MYRPTVLAVLLALTGLSAAAATFTDRTAFEATITVSLAEDFESLGTSTTSFTGPTTLPSGVTVSSPSNRLFVAGPGLSTNPTTAIGTDSPRADSLSFALPGFATAFGADFFQNDGGGDQFPGDITFSLSFFDGTSLVGTETATVSPNGGSFFGITELALFNIVTVLATPTGACEVVDNLTADAANSPVVPLPAPGLPLLSGLLAPGAAGARRG